MEQIRKNIFKDLPIDKSREFFEDIHRTSDFRLERIVSFGQSTPENQWFDQEMDEWVILISGSASLQFEGQDEEIGLIPGDHLLIPAHQKHRVSRTDPAQPSFWLALHF